MQPIRPQLQHRLCRLPLATRSYLEPEEQLAPWTKALFSSLLLEQDYMMIRHLLEFVIEDIHRDVKASPPLVDAVDSVAWWLIMDVLSGVWFRPKLIGGRYPALQPGWSCRSIVSSVTSRGLILQRPRRFLFGPVMYDSADGPWHPCGRTATIWRHRQQQAQKKLFPHLALAEEVYFGQSASWCQKRHSLWGVNREQSEVLGTSTHPHRCTHMLRQTQTSDRYRSDTLMNSQC